MSRKGNKKNRQVVLSIDQSLANTGYTLWVDGSVKSYGVIQTKNEKKKRRLGDMDDKSRRVRKIVDALDDIIVREQVDKIVCEEYAGFSQSKGAADALATSRTIVVCLSKFRGIPLTYIPACDAKEALTGDRKASKDKMNDCAGQKHYWFEREYSSKAAKSGWNGKAEHVADSIGIYMAAKIQNLI